MRLTKKIFTDLAIIMIGFGLFMGCIFPVFMIIIGIPSNFVLTKRFIFSCLAAGTAVGAINIGIARNIVGNRLKVLSSRMKYIQGRLKGSLETLNPEDCTSAECILPVDSQDEIGESSQAFNDLVETLASTISTDNAIKAFNEILASHIELKTLTTKALQIIMGYTHAQAGAILIEAQGDLSPIAVENIKTPQSLADSDTIQTILKSKQGRQIQYPEDILIQDTLLDFKPREIIIEPLLNKDLCIGVLILASSNKFNLQQNFGLDMHIKSLTMALRNAITYDQLQRLAAKDPLTSVYNRRFGMTRLQEEFTRSRRSNTPIGVIMFDIDHFKLVNDTYGHPIGDKILVSLTRIARLAIREGDILVRYGGEEFLVILPGASKSDTLFIAERLRHMVEDSSTKSGTQSIEITISAGAVSYPELECDDEQSLIKQADNALYMAKEAGRNRVQIG